MAPTIQLNTNTMADEEIAAAKAVLDSGFVTMGARCLAFEKAFAEYLGVEHAVMVNSGSSANLLAAFTMANPICPQTDGRRRIGPGTEVIVPALTWSTTVWPFVQAGAVPVFVDCDPETLQVHPDAIEAAITPKTAAIAIVHVLGGAVDAPSVRSIADRHGLWLFEDTCESLGVRWKGQQVGSFGHMASFSFYFAHHITTIEGGMVVTNDAEIADLLRAMRAHGWVRHMQNGAAIAAKHPEIDSRFLFLTTGFNLRPTEINGAIGLVQLKKLDGFNAVRRQVATLLDEGLEPLRRSGDLLPMRFPDQCEPAPFGYPVLCRSSGERHRLQSLLEKNGIETRPIICGNLARQPALEHVEHRAPAPLSGADRVMDTGLYWGTHPFMRPQDVNFIVQTVKRHFQ